MKSFLVVVLIAGVTFCSAQSNSIYGNQFVVKDSVKIGGKIVIQSSLIKPLTDNEIDLGCAGRMFRDIYVYSAIATSDIRKKENIQPLTYGLKELLQLDALTYNFKSDSKKKTRIGFSAQQVQGIIPEVVSVGEDADNTLGISYMDLIPVLLNAIKEQQWRIERLEEMQGAGFRGQGAGK